MHGIGIYTYTILGVVQALGNAHWLTQRVRDKGGEHTVQRPKNMSRQHTTECERIGANRVYWHMSVIMCMYFYPVSFKIKN